ncbi:MAG: adenylate/guanylate cyclase domain-containing protein [Anaerolineales bacterium]
MTSSTLLSHRIGESIYTILEESGDSPKLKAGKIQFGITMLLGILNGLIFAFVYAAFNETGFAFILCLLAFITLVILVLLRYKVIRFDQAQNIYLATNMLGNFLGTLALGGIANSTGVFLYILGSPLGKITGNTREFLRWFSGSIGLIILEVILHPVLRTSNNIPPGVSAILWGVNFIVVCGFIFGNLVTLLKQRDTALEELGAEKIISETLLLNVLPKKVADQLKQNPGTIAETYDAVTIIFADIVGFTPLSTQLDPTEMISLLNAIYTKFDALSEKYQVEKIRTIGDNYMAASGVPEPNERHAYNIAMMALEMQEHARELTAYNGFKILFRIGINTGPVIAGIVGKKKFQYDIWGDAVNTASRMETYGEAGKIQVAQTTYELLKDAFILEPRGIQTIKGKGQMKTWFLIGIRE